MGLKVAVVGGGSTYTPELIEGFARRADRAADGRARPARPRPRAPRDRRRARRADPAARGLAGAADPDRRPRRGPRRGRRSCSSSCASAARRRGSWTRRCRSRFDTIGQETTGPGGFAKALRTVPVVLEIAEESARRGAPGAWLVDFTNPVGIVTQALLDAGHRAIGLCNVAIGFQRRIAARFGVAPERVELEHVGLNHLTWIRAVRVDGVDRLPELLDAADEAGRGRSTSRSSSCARSGRSPPTTSATTTRSTRCCGAARRREPRRRGHGDRARAAGAVPRPDARPRSRPCSSAAAAPSTARRRRS